MGTTGYLLGYDIGSSSIKASLLEIDSGRTAASATSPESEMEIISSRPGRAEQHPDLWWEHVMRATALLRSKNGIDLHDVKAIGIAYQMHGLVMVDSHKRVLAPSIIWCDSRAVEIGDKAFEAIGKKKCLRYLLNSPGNFTASKLKWVKDNLPPDFQDNAAGRLYRHEIDGQDRYHPARTFRRHFVGFPASADG
jgi:xylulokinase